MLIYVLRHGITQWNKLKKVQGAIDIPLAPEGIELAKRTGEALKDVPFDICFTSPLARAKQTAHYVLGNRQIPVIEDKRIQEIDFGVLEGSRFKDEQGKIISHEMEIFFEEPQKFERPQNGENISDILKRTRGFWVEKKQFLFLLMDALFVHCSRMSIRIRNISGMDVCLQTAVSIYLK